MRILVSNDDGIYSPGIATLARMAAHFGDVRVVAPDVERSSAGHAITTTRPVRYRRTTNLDGIESYRVDGTPADCVALGIFLWEHVDVVLSGINHGLNLGNGIWHSGTVAAAKQAALLGIPAIAFSAPIQDESGELAEIAPWLERCLTQLLEDDRAALINVNFPARPRGLRWTAQAVGSYDGAVVPGTDPMGRAHYWFTVVPLEHHAEGTDAWAVANDLVSLTPLQLDLTDHTTLARITESS